MARKVSQAKIEKAKLEAQQVVHTAHKEVDNIASTLHNAEENIKRNIVKSAKANKQLLDNSLDVAQSNTQQTVRKIEKYVTKNKTPLIVGAGVTALVLMLGKIIFRKK